MTIRLQQAPAGSVLVIALVFCAIVGAILVAYLSMVSGQYKLSHRSQTWNQCIPLCEAGIEEAMSHINHINTTSNFAINGWVLDGGAYRKQRSMNGGTMWMQINTEMPPTITVQGSLRMPTQSNSLNRFVRVKTKINLRFNQAILARGTVVCNSSGARVDSFNSGKTNESTLGQYDPLKATDRATIATVAKTAGVVDLGNLDLYGRVGTGPGGTVTVGSQGNVGSTTWNSNPANNGQIQPGYFTDDVNLYIPDGIVPSGFVMGVAPGGGTVNGTNYAYILNDGDYTLNGINLNNANILIQGKARLYVNGTTQVKGQIVIAPDASVEWYAGGSFDVSGGGIVNSPGLAKNFSLIGLNNCLSISYSGNARWCGTVYAPKATVTVTGGTDGIGAIVASTLKMTGGMGFHYDEALKGDPREGRFVAASWQEM